MCSLKYPTRPWASPETVTHRRDPVPRRVNAQRERDQRLCRHRGRDAHLEWVPGDVPADKGFEPPSPSPSLGTWSGPPGRGEVAPHRSVDLYEEVDYPNTGQTSRGVMVTRWPGNARTDTPEQLPPSYLPPNWYSPGLALRVKAGADKSNLAGV